MGIPAHKHSLAVRWHHWINVPLLHRHVVERTADLLGERGLRHPLGRRDGRPILPGLVVCRARRAVRLAEGMALHFFFMWFFAINGVVYVSYTWLSGEWRSLVPIVTRSRSRSRGAARPASAARGTAAAEIQRRAADRLHAGDPDGRGIGRHGPGDLQADPLAWHVAARRLRMGEMGALLARGRLCAVLRGARRSGREGGLEELSRHGDGRRSDADRSARPIAAQLSRVRVGHGRRVGRLAMAHDASADRRTVVSAAAWPRSQRARGAVRVSRDATHAHVPARESKRASRERPRRHVRRLRPGRLAAARRCRRRDAVPDVSRISSGFHASR